MLLIAGLGNPGDKFTHTRHNVGFMLLDSLALRLNLTWKFEKKFQAFVASFNIDSTNLTKLSNSPLATLSKQIKQESKFHKVYLLKPQTFMNLSGESISPFVSYFNASCVLVAHDELDIPFGDVRFKVGGSSGGHNGLKSIDSCYGQEYARLRFGIGHLDSLDSIFANLNTKSTQNNSQNFMQDSIDRQKNVVNFVLGEFSNAEKLALPHLIEHSVSALCFFAIYGDMQLLQQCFMLKNAKNPNNKSSPQGVKNAF